VDRVSDGERNAAIRAVEAALSEGRIIQADRDRRVDQAQHAQTSSELQMITQDLAHRAGASAWTTYEPPAAETDRADEGEQSPPAQVTYGPSQDQVVAAQVTQMYGTKPAASRVLVLVPIIFFLVIAIGAGAVILAVVGSVNDGIESTFDEFGGPQAESSPELFTPTGFDDLIASIRAQTGSTMVFEAGLYPGYAVTTIPAEVSGKRAISYYYDGDLTESTKTTSTYDRFDLASIDASVLVRLSRKVRMLVEDPTIYYVLVRKPQDGSTTWLAAYVSNEFGESGYLRATKDGTIVDRNISS